MTNVFSAEQIAAAFAHAREQGRVALIPYVMAGYPDLATSEELAVALCEAGGDILELGVPFSDPLADGVTIQAAAHRSLEQGMTLTATLALARRISLRVSTPIVLMGYYNPIYSFGVERFCSIAGSQGVRGVIVPDLPPEEADPLWKAANRSAMEMIFLISPTSTPERIARVAEIAGRTGLGFIYCVSLSGVTGARDQLPEQLGAFIGRVRAATNLPLAVGFGVSRPEHVAEIGALADGAVVASALLNAVDAAPPEERVAAGVAFLRALQSGAAREALSRKPAMNPDAATSG